jgi:RNA polymerase sigma-70 factor (ECF subfamily)
MSETEVLRIFEANRPHLMGLAYRMSGTVTDAEDVVQDAWLRWHGTDRAAVACPKAYLLRVTMRLCLDRAWSAQARREAYVGPWLPEPIVDLAQIGTAEAGPQSQAERTDEPSVALLLVLERLSPLERAAFLLHDVFDFSFDEIGATLGRAPSACRKLASRARQRIRQERPTRPVPPDLARQFAARFHYALQSGDLTTFAEMLAEDAVLIADGGGRVYAALRPICGRDRIVRFLFAHRVEVRMAEGNAPIAAQHGRRFPIHGGRWRSAHLVAGLELGRTGESDLSAAQSRQASAPLPNHDGRASTNGSDTRLVLVARRVSGWMADFRSLRRANSRMILPS